MGNQEVLGPLLRVFPINLCKSVASKRDQLRVDGRQRMDCSMCNWKLHSAKQLNSDHDKQLTADKYL